MSGKQIRVGYSLPAQQRFLQRRLAGAFLEMIGALPGGRPEPRAMWDNVARRDNPAHPKGYDAIAAGQIALRAAIASGDAQVIEETARRVVHYFDELKAAALAPYLERAGGTATEAVLVDASKETLEAAHALTLAGIRPLCRATLDYAVRETREALTALTTWSRRAERDLLAPGKHATGARS